MSSAPHDDLGPRYPGTCRDGPTRPERAPARRFRLRAPPERFVDAVHGDVEPVRDDDFVVQRADGLYAYQLAVVVDDALAGVTDIVRGADLAASTPRQIHLQRRLGYPTPSSYNFV